MAKICLDCGKDVKILKEGFCPKCYKKLSIPKKKETFGRPKGWDPQKDILWKPQRGNGICERCYTEVFKSELELAEDIGYYVCKECQAKRNKIRKGADEYWKRKEPTLRKDI